jgi:hypothetical protein
METKSRVLENKAKSFVKSFDFNRPRWDKMPEGFIKQRPEGLTLEENHLYDAITLAWLTTTAEGKAYFYQKLGKRLAAMLIIAAASLALVAGIPAKQRFEVKAAKERAVNSVQEIIESTVSGILKN